MKQALFVGRFQPFHMGHLSVIKKALETEDRLIIMIGSAEENHEPANPFTAGERFQMIEAALDAEGVSHDRYAIIPIRNVENFMLWTTHVDQYIPSIHKIYTGSDIVKALYKAHDKYEIEDVEFVSNVSGTVIREKILKSDEEWKQLVHPAVAELIEKWDGVKRIQMVS
jgi:nicotinamide-nucleotide adenylyltransferase